MRLGLLLCDHVRPGFQVLAGDYPEYFRRLFGDSHSVEIETFDLTAGQFPDDLNQCDGWISSGSRHSVYDDVEWVGRFADLVRQMDHERRRYVGVCFGAQMIGHALGGEVKRADRGWQVGIKRVQVLEKASWMEPAAASFRILHSNADQISRPPDRMTVLGSSETVPVSMVAVDGHFLGLQGHPEFTPTYSAVLMEARRETLIPDEVVNEGLNSLSEPPDTKILASWITSFLSHR